MDSTPGYGDVDVDDGYVDFWQASSAMDSRKMVEVEIIVHSNTAVHKTHSNAKWNAKSTHRKEEKYGHTAKMYE